MVIAYRNKKMAKDTRSKKMYMINNAIFFAKRNVYTKLNDRLGKNVTYNYSKIIRFRYRLFGRY